MIVSAIVAVGKNLEIGKNNDLLWHLPADMKYFKETTTGHHIITGRKSYESIPEKYRPLPNRINVVVTRQEECKMDGAIVMNSIESAITFAEEADEKEVFIIGGGQIYNQSIRKDLVNRLYITWVDESFEADTYFPSVDLKHWKKMSERKYPSDERNKFNITFSVYEKI
ncbi:dihydrofolate reductase [Flavobacteriales bacterium]|nr:dihydrofolate reductase [Flavobacteriales bacterium]